MQRRISHDRTDETPEAKARWFRSLPLEERMELLCEFTDLALAVRPELALGARDAEPSSGRIRVLSKPPG